MTHDLIKRYKSSESRKHLPYEFNKQKGTRKETVDEEAAHQVRKSQGIETGDQWIPQSAHNHDFSSNEMTMEVKRQPKSSTWTLYNGASW